MIGRFKYLVYICCFLFLAGTRVDAQFDLPKLELPKGGKAWKEATSITGSVSANMQFYSVSKINNRRPPFIFNIYGTPTIHVNDIDIPVLLRFGTYQGKYRQQFNQLGIAPSYKWIKVHLGFSRVSFSPLALSGHQFLGVGVELNPGKIRFGLVYGRFKKRIEPDSAALVQNTIPEYKQSGLGIKIGYGTSDNYVDLVIFLGKDRQKSLEDLPAFAQPAPDANAVIALSTHQKIIKRLDLKIDLGLSAYTNDYTTDNIDDKKFSIIRLPGIFLQDKAGTQYTFAIKSGITYKFRDFKLGKSQIDLTDTRIKLIYDRIDPDYQSMGTYFFRNDIQRIRTGLGFNIWQRKIGFDTQIGFEHNDVLKTRFTKNNRAIGSVNLRYMHSEKLFFNLRFSNFRTRLRKDVTPTRDTLLVNQVNRDISVNGIYKFQKNGDRRQVTGFVGFMSGKNISEMATVKNLSSFIIRATYGFTYTKLDLRLTPAFSINRYKFTGYSTTRIIPSVDASRKFFDEKLEGAYNLGFVFTTLGGFANFGIRNNLRVSYVFMKKHRFSFQFY